MKKIYSLSIDITDKPQYPSLEVCYNSQEKAMEMLSRFYADFKKAHNVPDESDEQWNVFDDTYRDHRTVSVYSTRRNGAPHCSFFGKVLTSYLLDDEDEIECMENMIVSFDNNPDVLCKLATPIIKGFDASVFNIIDVKNERRLDMPVGMNISIASPEKVSKYYELKDKLS